jgi:ABC-type glutathione transport system ATPase component
MEPLLRVNNIVKNFAVEKGALQVSAGQLIALNNISFDVPEQSTLGIVGESGSGKTTLAKIILGLIQPTSGTITFNPEVIHAFHRDVQIIFQNPYNSLNPVMRIQEIISEPLIIHHIVPRQHITQRAQELLSLVGLDVSALTRYPRQFSGGQRQRICIARALASQPRCLVLDEPISSLDVTIQQQMLELFIRLKQEMRLTYLFISHNLAVIKHIADSVMVMRNGAIVEQSDSSTLFVHPKHEYTRQLLEAARG